jgi:hypothetical protein
VVLAREAALRHSRFVIAACRKNASRCARLSAALHFQVLMPDASLILCDGCGQPATPQHTARRLQRLEWATRYRPIHLHTLVLGAVSPESQTDYFYSPDEAHGREAALLFTAAGIDRGNKTADVRHSEFQRRGIFLAHVLECPLEAPSSLELIGSALIARLPAVFTRIRRSLKPRRLVLIAAVLAPLIDLFATGQLGCELVLDDGGRPFALDIANPAASGVISRLQDVLAVPAAR